MRHRLVHLRCHYIFDSLPPALQHVPDDQQGSDYANHEQPHIGLRAYNGDLILVRVQRTMDLKQIHHNRWVACEPTRVYVTLQRLALEGKANVLVQHANRGEPIRLWTLATPAVFPLRQRADTAYLLYAFKAEITSSRSSAAKSRIGLICQTNKGFQCLLYVRSQAFDSIRRAPGFLRRGIQALSIEMSEQTTNMPGLPGPRRAYREARLVCGTLSVLIAETQRGLRGRSSTSSQSSQSSRVSGSSRSVRPLTLSLSFMLTLMAVRQSRQHLRNDVSAASGLHHILPPQRHERRNDGVLHHSCLHQTELHSNHSYIRHYPVRQSPIVGGSEDSCLCCVSAMDVCRAPKARWCVPQGASLDTPAGYCADAGLRPSVRQV